MQSWAVIAQPNEPGEADPSTRLLGLRVLRPRAGMHGCDLATAEANASAAAAAPTGSAAHVLLVSSQVEVASRVLIVDRSASLSGVSVARNQSQVPSLHRQECS
jgi:hypothetical protein